MKLFSFLSSRAKNAPPAGVPVLDTMRANWLSLFCRQALADGKWAEAAQAAFSGIAGSPDAYELHELLLLAFRGSGGTEPKPREVDKLLTQVNSGPWRSVLLGERLVFEENFLEAWAELSPLPENFPGSRLFPAIRVFCGATLLANHRPALEHPAQVRHRLQQDLATGLAQDARWSGAVKLFEEKDYPGLLAAVTPLFAERCSFPRLDAVERTHLAFLTGPKDFDFSGAVVPSSLAEDSPPVKVLAAELFSFLATCQKAEAEFTAAGELSPQFAKAQKNLALVREQRGVLVSVLRDLRL